MGAVVVGAIATLPALASRPAASPTSVATSQPIGAAPLPIAAPFGPPPAPPRPVSPADTTCGSTTITSLWAHYDDDLIFANPALGDAIAAGKCVRTIFVTAADAGSGLNYSRGREQGIRLAYNRLRGDSGDWTEKQLTLLSGALISQWTPNDNPRISITFLRLPDGGLQGTGFPLTGWSSLPRLMSGKQATIAPIQGGPSLTKDALIATVAELIEAYHSDDLIMHMPSESKKWSPGDHPDHAAVGTIGHDAALLDGFDLTHLQFAIGYPNESLAPNVTGDALAHKLDAYRAYAVNDSVVACYSDAQCLATKRFGSWLQRQYFVSDFDVFPAG